LDKAFEEAKVFEILRDTLDRILPTDSPASTGRALVKSMLAHSPNATRKLLEHDVLKQVK
jgi:hypothetical protein